MFALNGCLSPRYFSNRTVDVTNNPAWWGELRGNRVVRLKEDSVMNDDVLCGGYVHKSLGKHQDQIIKIEMYKANPSLWPELKIVKQDTRLRCVKLERFFSLEFSAYRIYAEIFDGEFKGKVVALFGVNGDPGKKGSLLLNTGFFEHVNGVPKP
jgi:hypothetical protein